jgi:hemolysin III
MAEKEKTTSLKYNIKLSFTEEIGNVLTHGTMALLFLTALPIIAIHGYLKGGVLLATGQSIFIISLFFMFLSSALYHAMDFDSQHKYVFRILDHVFIYVAIAGTYTPVALYVIGGTSGYVILAIQWLCALAGIIYKSTIRKSIHGLSLALYLIMGWAAVFFLPQLLDKTSPLFLAFIVAGGVAYSIGAWFYAQKDRPYFHLVWHFCINIAAILHFIAIAFFI